MDLTQFDVRAAAEAGADLRLRHPSTGEPLGTDEEPITVRLVGRDSPRVKDAAKQLERRKVKGEDIDREEEGVVLLVASIIGWSGIVYDGEPLDFSPANARKLLSDPRTEWIGEQIGPFVLSRRNFAQNMPSV